MPQQNGHGVLHNFVPEAVFGLGKTYPMAAGLRPLFMGIGKGGFLQLLVKNTGCTSAGLYSGGDLGGSGSASAFDGGMASIWLLGRVMRACC